MGETFAVGLLKLAKFMYFLAAVISYLHQCAVCISYMPYLTDLFLLENPQSPIQRNAIFTRALVQ